MPTALYECVCVLCFRTLYQLKRAQLLGVLFFFIVFLLHFTAHSLRDSISRSRSHIHYRERHKHSRTHTHSRTDTLMRACRLAFSQPFFLYALQDNNFVAYCLLAFITLLFSFLVFQNKDFICALLLLLWLSAK